MSNSDLRLVVLSGPICSGKSSLARLFSERHDAAIVKTRDLILELKPRVKQERAALQRAGEALDRGDGGKWISGALARVIEGRRSNGSPHLFVLDSARIIPQVESLREAFGGSVFHVHLTAKDAELEARYGTRSDKTQELPSYADVRRSKTERYIERLAAVADAVVETDRCTPDAVFVRATALLGLYPRSVTQLVDALVGGQYGSEGKGNIVGHIAPEYRILVRVGGPNAGHQVYGSPVQVYYHLPSGSERAPQAKLVLGAGSILRVPKLLAEIQEHKLTADRLAIDPQAMVIEDRDIEAEGGLQERISSTRQGVGSATARKIMGRGQEGEGKVRLAKDVRELKPYIKGDVQDIFERAYLAGDRILLEGTQGTTLSECKHVS
jgi:adenylosuccinate synthase